MDVLCRNNVTLSGPEGAPADRLRARLRLRPAPVAARRAGVRRTTTGWSCSTTSAPGASDPAAYDPERHGSLDGYAEDVLELLAALDLGPVVFVGHSVSSMIGVLAAVREPARFAKLVLVGPSPRYVDDAGYTGGFSRADIDELLDSLESNFLGWSSAMAPVIMGNPERPELGEELTNSFCRTDPEIAARFARVTFLSDNRADLARGLRPDPRAPDARGRDRPAGRRRVRARRHPGLGARDARRDGALPEPQRPGRDDRRDPGLPVNAEEVEESALDLYEHAPCGYLSTDPDGADHPGQPHVPGVDRPPQRGARRRAALPGPAQRGRPDLPRDALRAAPAHAGLRARDRAWTSCAPTARACRRSSTRCSSATPRASRA